MVLPHVAHLESHLSLSLCRLSEGAVDQGVKPDIKVVKKNEGKKPAKKGGCSI